jgi:hypothetical protein
MTSEECLATRGLVMLWDVDFFFMTLLCGVPHPQRHPFFGRAERHLATKSRIDFAGRRHQVSSEIVIRSTAWQAQDFGSGCAGLRSRPAKLLLCRCYPGKFLLHPGRSSCCVEGS